MSDQVYRFDDGAAYERFMGIWSRLAGDVFLDWLAPRPGLRWADIGCGNGAFTERLLDRAAAALVEGIDPSEGQLAYARHRLAGRPAQLRRGSAVDLPYADASLDAAVMALVIFFVPDPAKGVAEMARIVAPGGSVSAYAWDFAGGGFPVAPVQAELAAMGGSWPAPPFADAARPEALRALWAAAGMTGIETRQITVERCFADFEDYWSVAILGPGMASVLSGWTPDQVARLKENVRPRLAADAAGRITATATANAVKGIVG